MTLLGVASFLENRTVFLITDQKLPPVPIAHYVLCMAAVCAALVISVIFARGNLKLVFGAGFAIAGAVVGIHFINVVTERLPFELRSHELESAIHQYEHGDYMIADGTVKGYEFTDGKHGICYYLDATQVCTYDSTIPVGYHFARNGFVLRKGMRVRIFYHEPLILRIDVVE